MVTRTFPELEPRPCVVTDKIFICVQHSRGSTVRPRCRSRAFAFILSFLSLFVLFLWSKYTFGYSSSMSCTPTPPFPTPSFLLMNLIPTSSPHVNSRRSTSTTTATVAMTKTTGSIPGLRRGSTPTDSRETSQCPQVCQVEQRHFRTKGRWWAEGRDRRMGRKRTKR